VFLALAGQQGAGLVAVLLPDPHRVVLGHDPVVTGALEEVALGGEGGERVGGGCGVAPVGEGQRPQSRRRTEAKGAAGLERETPQNPTERPHRALQRDPHGALETPRIPTERPPRSSTERPPMKP